MKHIGIRWLFSICCALILSSCSTTGSMQSSSGMGHTTYASTETTHRNYADRLPSHIKSNEKTILINPRVHAWGAYQNGELVRAGIATAGGSYCPDIKRSCKTRAGSFRIQSLGSSTCKSTRYPLPRGGAPMPYCMFFDGNRGIHGSPAGAVVEANVSHGCVRVPISDAEWLRYDFAHLGTRVVVEPY